MNQLYVIIIKFVSNKVAVVCKVVKREQTSRAHLVFGGNVVLYQDRDSMERTEFMLFVSI